jgi:hypothetical protein
MAVPKKKMSKSKKNSRKSVWKRNIRKQVFWCWSEAVRVMCQFEDKKSRAKYFGYSTNSDVDKSILRDSKWAQNFGSDKPYDVDFVN